MAAIAAAAVALCAYLDQRTRVFDYLEQKADGERLNAYAKCNGQLVRQARNRIQLVTLSDYSFDAANPFRLPGPPAPRDYHAKVIRELTRAGAKVIAFDLSFDLPGPRDKALADAARASGRVLWICGGRATEPPELVYPIAQLQRASPHWGHSRMPLIDPEHPAVDRIEPVILDRHSHSPVSAFCLEAARMALGLEGRFRRVPGGWRAGDLAIPVDREGDFKIKYLGAPGTFPEMQYEQIYHGAAADAMFRENRFFRDKIVLIGDTTNINHDLHQTPLGPMTGVEIHAHAIATLLQRGFIREAPSSVHIALLCSLAALICLFAAAWRLCWAALFMVLLLPAYFLFNIWLFVDGGISLHLAAPSAAIVLATLGVLIECGLTEEREKTRIRGLLRRYVSPQIAEYVINHPEKCVLGGAGERVTATVLFSDIRGFTALSEQLTPEQMVARLNEYFQIMTDIVFKHDGAVARFVGDGMLALFGVPVPHPDHARRAVAAAIDMQSALLELQEQWRARGLPLFDIGVGISTGEMVVGNIGSRQRTDFAVYGSQVNLASRIESLNKGLRSRILITEPTYEAARKELAARGPVTVRVQGLEEAVVVYEVIGWRDAPGASLRSLRPFTEP